jgi:hypothetical protein
LPRPSRSSGPAGAGSRAHASRARLASNKWLSRVRCTNFAGT